MFCTYESVFIFFITPQQARSLHFVFGAAQFEKFQKTFVLAFGAIITATSLICTFFGF